MLTHTTYLNNLAGITNQNGYYYRKDAVGFRFFWKITH